MSDDQKERYRRTLELHAQTVRSAENELERARDALRYWIGDAALRKVMTVSELAEYVDGDEAEILRIVAYETKNQRHTGLR